MRCECFCLPASLRASGWEAEGGKRRATHRNKPDVGQMKSRIQLKVINNRCRSAAESRCLLYKRERVGKHDERRSLRTAVRALAKDDYCFSDPL
jgi:hypothetical protein